MKVFVFPGQGSQQKGMGGSLFDEFEELTEIANSVLGYSIKKLCIDDPDRRLGQTKYTQPAIFTVNALSYLKRIATTRERPAYVAGHSLGEYNALLAAGAFDFEAGLKLVQQRSLLMSRSQGGGMAAVIGLSEDGIKEVIDKNKLTTIQIANYNSPSQVVVSGPHADIQGAKNIFESAGGLYLQLNVSGAFHSRYMEDARKEFASYIDSLKFSQLTIPVISNVTARSYQQNDLKRNLIDQITHPVKWTESIRFLMGKGDVEFEEVGPGNVLAKLIQTIKRDASPVAVAFKNKVTIEQDQKTFEELAPKNQDMGKKEAIVSAETNQTASADVTKINAKSLGDSEFKKDYGLSYAYLTGSMYRGIASKDMVVRMAKAGMMGFFGTGGLPLITVERAIVDIQKELTNGDAYGMNLLHNPGNPDLEEKTIDLYLRYGVRTIEASAFMGVTSALVRYCADGIRREAGNIVTKNRIIAKVSRPEVAKEFLSPAPDNIVEKLRRENKLSEMQATLLRKIPIAGDLCVEADSGGHTDGGVSYALMPAMMRLRDDVMKKYSYSKRIRVGAAGGIGTPEAAAAALILGADFILTGSINQCTVEAGTSNTVKDMLQAMNVQDTDYAPAGDMFEFGSKIQVLKKKVFFPARAKKLYELYMQHDSIDDIDEKTKKRLQERYFKRTFEKVYRDCKDYYPPQEIERAERSPKLKMAMIFKWYLGWSTQLALSGDAEHKVDYQVHSGPALGAFNSWVKGSRLENWNNRHVDEIGLMLLRKTADVLNNRYQKFRLAGS